MSIPHLLPLIDLGDGSNETRRPVDHLMARHGVSTMTARLGEALRTGSELSRELIELAVLVVAVRRRSQFGILVHLRLATAAGIDIATANALVAGTPTIVADYRQALTIRVAENLLDSGRISQSLYEEARAALGDGALADLVALIGYHNMIAMTISAYRD